MAHNYSFDDLTQRWTAAQPLVKSFISSQISDFHDAQDALQEVASALVQDFGQYDPAYPFLPWVIAIARNRVIDFYRRTSVDRIIFDGEALESIAAAYERVDKDSDSVFEAMEHCVKRASGKSRMLLEFRYQEAMSSAEIASRLRITINAVDVALHRIRLALRDCILQRLGRTGRAS